MIKKVLLPSTKFKNKSQYLQKTIPIKDGPLYVIHDGPPYASGILHIGHALNKIIKDITLRYRLLRGNRVYMRPGFDTHGLPVELKARTKAKTPIDIRHEARQYANSCVKQQIQQFQSWNILADWSNPYRTMDTAYVVKQLHIFNSLFRKGLVYRDFKPVYWSPANQTALAEAEIEYSNITSKSIYCRFKVKECLSLLIWTTTPYTIPANMAVCINKNIEYVVCQFKIESFIISATFVDKLKSLVSDEFIAVTPISAIELLSMTYKHPLYSSTHSIIHGDHVSDSQTGLVHTAPGHGNDDFLICKQHNIPVHCPVDERGLFDASVNIPKLVGLAALDDGTDAVIDLLTKAHLLLKQEPFTHQYPVDWRKKQPVITRAALQWFCTVDQLKDRAANAINGIQFTPIHGKDKLLTSIMSRSEWCISRQRFWGVFIPMLYDLRTNKPYMTDALFQHIVDTIKQHGPDAWFTLPTSEFLPPELKYMLPHLIKEDDTMDVWFDSGVSWHILDGQADCYIEGTDQHRGWFQSSLLTSVAVNNKSPTKQIITHGFVLDEKGRKMSKSIGNVIDPKHVIQQLGVDGLRLWCANCHFTKDVQIGKRSLEQTGKELKKWRIAIKYLLGNLNDQVTNKSEYHDLTDIDRWLLAELVQAQKMILGHYSKFEYHLGVQAINLFISLKLSSIYFETVKDRLYCDDASSRRRKSALFTMEIVLLTFLKWIAPITPQLAEESYAVIGNTGSVFEMDYELLDRFENEEITNEFVQVQSMRQQVNRLLDAAVKSEFIGSPMDGYVVLPMNKYAFDDDLCDLFGVSKVVKSQTATEISIIRATGIKCGRCWKRICTQGDVVCTRCAV